MTTLDAARSTADALRTQRRLIVEAIADGVAPITDPRGSGVKIVVLAEAVPGVGKVRARRVLDALGVAHGTLAREVPSRVMQELVAALRENGA